MSAGLNMEPITLLKALGKTFQEGLRLTNQFERNTVGPY
jgi:hypothetical protein